jgi:hypothetical protein
LVFVVLFGTVVNAQNIVENFETGLPSSAPATQTDYTLASGTWSLYNAYRGTNTSYICSDGGTVDLRTLKNGGYAISPVMSSGIGSISFKEGRGSRTITVQKTTDNGVTWTTIGTPVSTSCGTISIDVNDASADRIKIWNASTSDEDIDNVTITGYVDTSGISVTPTSLSFGNVVVNATSSEKTYTISGTSLSPENGSINITAPDGFEVSLTSSTGFTSSLLIPYTGTVLDETVIYVHFTPQTITSYNSQITNQDGGTEIRSVGVSGNGISTTSMRGLFVSPSGNDTNPGTIESPFLTLSKALSVAGPDSTIYLMGGIYTRSSTETINTSGLPGMYIKIWAFPGEKPVYDFSAQASSDGISMKGNYCHLKGIEVTHAYHNGINISGHYNIVENCSIHDNRNSGLQMGSSSSTANPSNNLIINCDSYLNYDAPIGGNADGFAVKWNIGTGNKFISCRAYNNSDDGWDLWMAINTIEIDSCFAFRNGVDSWGQTGFDGNGNGIKLGGNYVATPHLVKNCIAFDNAGNTGRGFDLNNNYAGQTLYNCTAFRNTGDNYHFNNTLTTGHNVIKNCISYLGALNIKYADTVANSWQGFTVSSTDFVSLDTSLAVASRDSLGNLQNNYFCRLAAGSSMIDAGVTVGIPYHGSAPDLGAFEYDNIPKYTLAVSTVNGSVEITPNQTLYDSNTIVHLMAAPDARYRFIGWSGDVTDTINPLTIIMNSKKSITANFLLNQYTITSVVSGSGLMSPSGEVVVTEGDSIRFSIVPSAQWHVDSLIVDGENFLDSIAGYTFRNVLTNHLLHAYFSINLYTITVSYNQFGDVTPGTEIIPSGSNRRYNFVPHTQCYIDSVLIDGVPNIDSIEGYTFTNITRNHSIHVVFASSPFSITVRTGWNMISLPGIPSDGKLSSLFTTAISKAFSYETGYLEMDTLRWGIGYWVKFAAPQEFTLHGITSPGDTIPVKQGWNMIGTVLEEISVASIGQSEPDLVQSSFYEYNTSYTEADVLKPGKAYWVKVKSDGYLIFLP